MMADDFRRTTHYQERIALPLMTREAGIFAGDDALAGKERTIFTPPA